MVNCWNINICLIQIQGERNCSMISGLKREVMVMKKISNIFGGAEKNEVVFAEIYLIYFLDGCEN